MKTTTELLDRYATLKKEHPDSVLVFNMPVAYAMYEDDARLAAKKLGLPLHCSKSVLWVEFPHHHLLEYMTKMIKLGMRVAMV